ncbi:acyl-coenzyme A thioesterase 1 [Procambarus clarkii]|uniref:acyl-coenzyme A thioesterase 1 n=1 Tax=Procambarus clarkii TaxID=6728 RepID=UPI001E6739C2|nr:acyl-coenzyme A thioesterase 1-like [Procambarus clarkii]
MTDAPAEGGGLRLEVIPRVCVHDVPTTIRVSGLPPGAPVTLRADTHDDDGRKFRSNAHYRSDARGCVDVARSEALGGSFTGVFPAGLFTTLRGRGSDLHTRLFKSDCTTPWKVTVTAYKGHLDLEEEGDGGVRQVLERHLMGPGVRRLPVRHGRVRGALYLPSGPGPFPGIVDFFGGIGGLREYRAAMLASRGFATLALAYFNYDDLPKTIDNLDLEYFEEATEFLLSQTEVIPDRCAVLSSSKGADIGLASGIYLDKVTAVITIGGVLTGAKTNLTYQGQQILKAGDDWNFDINLNDDDMASLENTFRELYRHDSPQMPPCEAAPEDTFFLLVTGDEDTCCTKYAAEALVKRMKLHGREDNCRIIVYPGVGHIIETPYNAHGKYSNLKIASKSNGAAEGRNTIINWGGTAKGTCVATEDFWRELQVFFAHHVRDLSPWYQKLLEQK